VEVEVSRLNGVEVVPSDGAIGVELYRVIRFRNYRLFPASGPVRADIADALKRSGLATTALDAGDTISAASAILHGELMLDADGRYVVGRLEIVGGATNELLRAIPLGRVVMEVVRETKPAVVRVTTTERTVTTTSDLTTDEQTLALFYIARAAGENTNTAVALELGISPAAAAQRVARLRKRGWLPPAAKQGARR